MAGIRLTMEVPCQLSQEVSRLAERAMVERRR
jgi:hypothetical protein